VVLRAQLVALALGGLAVGSAGWNFFSAYSGVFRL